MSRFLLTWELGMNLGHLARLLPIACQLKARGHSVVVAVREIPAAAAILGPAGIPFIQAPHLPHGLPLPDRASGYADILLSQGWSDPQVLWGLAQSWHNLLRMVRPDALVLDYSPTAALAAKIAAIPTAMIGNGFELPPALDPLPPFPGFSWATAEKAAASERIAVDHANQAMRRFKRPPLRSLSDLFEDATTLFVTLPELDHYGARATGRYFGPLLGALRSREVNWPAGSARLFACLRPDTNHVDLILQTLRDSGCAVVCFAPGFTPPRLERSAGENLRFTSQPVDLDRLAADADACVSYGAEGTMAKFLLAGVPQLISPWHVEAHMAARRIEALGAAVVLRGEQNPELLRAALDSVCTAPEYKLAARDFATRHRKLQPDAIAQQVADVIEAMLKTPNVLQPLARSRG
jgi:UDP:flavonoid glycosyltransferase YjiC (YdhE family)